MSAPTRSLRIRSLLTLWSTILVVSATASPLAAGLLVWEDFDAPVGTPIENLGWTKTGAQPPLLVSPGNLSYPGYTVAVGQQVIFSPSEATSSYTRPVGLHTSGSVYLAFLIRVDRAPLSLGGPRVISLSGDGPFGSRGVFLQVVEESPATFRFGIDKTGSQTTSSDPYPYGATNLVVLKYEFDPVGIDQISIFVDPDPDALEPAPLFDFNEPSNSDADDIREIRLSGSGATNLEVVIDAIRVATSWEVAMGQDSVVARELGVQQIETTAARDGRSLYVAARWFGEFGLFASQDAGRTWSEWWRATGNVADVDVAVSAGKVYLAWADGTNGGVVRFDRLTGDPLPWFESLSPSSGASAIDEVALTSDLADGDDYLYLGVLETAGRLRVWYLEDLVDDGSEGLTELPQAIASITDAAGGLDMDWNEASPAVWLSWVDAASTVRVASWFSLLWQTVAVDATTPAVPTYRTRVSARAGSIVVAWEAAGEIAVRVRPNSSSGWGLGRSLIPPAGRSIEGFDVTADGGRGFQMVHREDGSGYDGVLMSRRSDYGAGAWSASELVNRSDSGAVAAPAIVQLSGSCPGSTGALYLDDFGLVRFALGHVDGPLGDPLRSAVFCDGFESGDSLEWDG